MWYNMICEIEWSKLDEIITGLCSSLVDWNFKCSGRIMAAWINVTPRLVIYIFCEYFPIFLLFWLDSCIPVTICTLSWYNMWPLYLVLSKPKPKPAFYPVGTRGPFPRARTWSWPLNMYLVQGQERVELYLHYCIHFHDLILSRDHFCK
jgi:hypothetical protein